MQRKKKSRAVGNEKAGNRKKRVESKKIMSEWQFFWKDKWERKEKEITLKIVRQVNLGKKGEEKLNKLHC